MRRLSRSLVALVLAAPAAAQQGSCTTAELQFEGTSDKGGFVNAWMLDCGS